MRVESNQRAKQSPFQYWTDTIQLHGLQHGIDISDGQRNILREYLELEKVCDDELDAIPLFQRGLLVSIALDFLRNGDASMSTGLRRIGIADETQEVLATSLKDIKDLIPEDRRTIFTDSLEGFLHTTLQLHQERSITDAVHLRRVAARQNIEVLFNILPAEVHNAANFARFQRMEMLQVEMMDLVDSFVDFAEDIHNGTLSVAPTLFNRFIFGVAGIMSIGRYFSQRILNTLQLYFSPELSVDPSRD